MTGQSLMGDVGEFLGQAEDSIPRDAGERANEEAAAELFRRLAEPFPASEIEWRVGTTTKDKSKGMALAFVTSRAVQQRLDDVCGPGRWSSEIRQLDAGKGYTCKLTILLPDGRYVTREDGSDESDIEGTKGGISGALKRAAVLFGVGRYLYYLDAPWVKIVPAGRSYRLEKPPPLPAWALPGGSGRPPTMEPKTIAAPPEPYTDPAWVSTLIHDLNEAESVDHMHDVWREWKPKIDALPADRIARLKAEAAQIKADHEEADRLYGKQG